MPMTHLACQIKLLMMGCQSQLQLYVPSLLVTACHINLEPVNRQIPFPFFHTCIVTLDHQIWG